MPTHPPSSNRLLAPGWWSLALLLSLLGIALALWLWRIHDLEDGKARERLQAQARIVHDNMGRQMEAIDLTLRAMQDHVLRPAGVIAADGPMLALLGAALPGVRMVTQLNAAGVVVASSRGDTLGQDRSDRLHFRQARADPNPQTLRIAAPYHVEGGTAVIALMRALRGPDGAFAGIVEATLSPEHFHVLLSSVLSSDDMTATLFHDNGETFMRRPPSSAPLPLGGNSPGTLFAQHRATGLPTDIIRGISVTGQDRVVAFHTLQRTELGMDVPLVIAMGRSPQAMLAWWSTIALRATALYVGVVLASGAGMWAWQTRRRRLDDIAAQQQAALADSEARFRSLTRLSSDWYWELDQSLRFARLDGDASVAMVPPLDVHLGKHRWDVPALNMTEADWQRHRDLLQARLPFRELLLARADRVRGVSWAAVSGEPIFAADGQFCGYRGTGRDVTEFMQAKEALARSEERLQLVLRGSNDAAWDVDLEGRVVYLSERWHDMVGSDASQALPDAEFWRALCHADDLERVAAVVSTAFENNASSYEVDFRIRHRDGHYVPVSSRAFIVRDNQGKAIRVAGVTTDLSERKRAEADREALLRAQTEQRLREIELTAAEQARAVAEAHAEKLRTLLGERDRGIVERDQLLGLLAHEIRQPLNNASAALQGAQLAMTETLQPRVTAAARLARAQAVLEQVIDTVNNSLAASTLLTRPDALSLQDFEIDTLIELALADLGPQARSRVVAQRITRARTAEVNVALLRLALRNLLVNALAYSAEDSEVALHVLTEDEPLSLVIEGIDSGRGIAPEQLPTLFERGTRGRHSTAVAGAGLGLYVVAQVVALHKGTVQVQARQPRGSIFRITLPQGGVG